MSRGQKSVEPASTKAGHQLDELQQVSRGALDKGQLLG